MFTAVCHWCVVVNSSSSSSIGSSSLPLTTQTAAASAAQSHRASENSNMHLPCDTVKASASVDTSVDQMDKTGPALPADDVGKARMSFTTRKPFAAADSVQSQASLSASRTLPATGLKSDSFMSTGQASDTDISKPSLQSLCANTSSSVGKVQSQPPSTSAVTSSISQTHNAVKCEPSMTDNVISQSYRAVKCEPSMTDYVISQSHRAVKCEPSMTATVASTSHVCITHHVLSIMLLMSALIRFINLHDSW